MCDGEYCVHDIYKILSGPQQTDIPHVFGFCLGPNDKRRIKSVPGCNDDTASSNPICQARHYLGPWEIDSFTSEEFDPPFPKCGDVKINSLILCKKPHWFNSGPHRIAIDLWASGDDGYWHRYITAVEEGFNRENLFVGALTAMGYKTLVKNPDLPRHILNVALIMTTGYKISHYLHRFNVKILPPQKAWELKHEACTPSSQIFNF